MDEAEFWQLIAECRAAAGDDTELAARLLFRRLRTLGADEIAAFARRWQRARSALFSWPVADAACLLLGPVDDEDLDPVRDWIISYGRTTAERIARTPDALADLAADAGSARAGSFADFVTEAHIAVTGTWPPAYDPDGPDDLTGTRTDLTDPAAVRRRFPRLAAQAGGSSR